MGEGRGDGRGRGRREEEEERRRGGEEGRRGGGGSETSLAQQTGESIAPQACRSLLLGSAACFLRGQQVQHGSWSSCSRPFPATVLSDWRMLSVRSTGTSPSSS